MIPRAALDILLSSAKAMPILVLMGPRQSGKTTLAKLAFPDYTYVTLSNRDTQHFAEEDPRAFLQQYNDRVIIDEAQMAPSLFSYLQELVDQDDTPGRFILTGSQNFLLMEQVSQSLAGRVALHKLLPLSLYELSQVNALDESVDAVMWEGAYPRVHAQSLQPGQWYADYITTYLERDVRSLKQISDLSSFQRFLRMCAARSGQILNLSSLANDCGIAVNTAKSWLSVLEASFIVHLLQPYYNNFNKRLMKSPKLYFYDTGLICSLLNIQTPEQLSTHHLRGELFETLIVNECMKFRFNRGQPQNTYYWRDKTGHEIDMLIDSAGCLGNVEIKSSHTMQSSFVKNLKWFSENMSVEHTSSVVYAGDADQHRSDVKVYSWRNVYTLFKEISS